MSTEKSFRHTVTSFSMSILRSPEKMRRVFFCTVFCPLMMGALCIAPMAQVVLAADAQEERVMPEGSFIDHFHAVRWGTFKNVSDEVRPYLLGVSQDYAIGLLENAGFEVTIFPNPGELERMQKFYLKEKNIKFDQAYNAFRGPGWHFWRVFIDYKVTILISNGLVVEVVAVVDTPIYP